MYPQSQDRLYKEVSALVPAARIPSAAEVSEMPYLKAVVKEALRWERLWCDDGWFSASTQASAVLKIYTSPDGDLDLRADCLLLYLLVLHHSAATSSLDQSKWNDSLLFCRMYPVVPLNGRVILDKDVTIGGYQFSKNVGLLVLSDFLFLFALERHYIAKRNPCNVE